MSIPSRPRPALSGLPPLCLAAALLAACENPLTDDGAEAGSPVPADTLDAQKGKDLANRYDFLQGAFLGTGLESDLAIEGKGFFILKGPDGFEYVRRPGMFIRDSSGRLHLGDDRSRLQGIRLSSDSNPYPSLLPGSAPKADFANLEDVRWPSDDVAPAQATTTVSVIRNLPADAWGKGSLLSTQAFLHHAEASDRLVGLLGSDGRDLGILAGDTLTLSATHSATVSSSFIVSPTSTLADLGNAMTAFLRSASVGGGLGTTVDLVTHADSYTLRGALTLYGNTAAIRDFRVTGSRAANAEAVARAFGMPVLIPAGTTRLTIAGETLRSPAHPSDRLAELYDAGGAPLGLEPGDGISLSGSIGDTSVESGPPMIYALPMTFGDLVVKAREVFRLPESMAYVDPVGSEDGIRDGSLVIAGYPGREWELRDAIIRSTDANAIRPSPNFFNTNLNFSTKQKAVDHQVEACSLDVYDAKGKVHRLALRISPTDSPVRWEWAAEAVGSPALTGVADGMLEFGMDGHVYPRGGRTLAFETGEGGGRFVIALDLGGLVAPGGSRVEARVSQDGFPAGRPEEFAIGPDGILSGAYSNGQSRALFQIPLADFPDRGGLERMGDHSFRESAASGMPSLTAGTDPEGGIIRSGKVEYRSEGEREKACALRPGC